ncbi:hypothetical protein BU24DRAFT_460485 [Aaosphaeria arxii CBS 175.79]|uniref:C2H2-type domain-containing protein n=1 Tax=Aaosphaeria arxii CBS 175.79 TaxID=1450172 RepID=A0A6A5XWA0_9PLEO|nr:uncharacterized protein BU24DRAFT_460485 [Aaosphaeria arxii CBS 175.79]KAF2017442.1 hypothetical protein BU24DRAFT_460485 [Aaosphaeria arxii CBS 175.79]
MAMQLASMVHGSGREREAHEHHHRQYQPQPQQPHSPHNQTQQTSGYYSHQPAHRPYQPPTSAAHSPYSNPQAQTVEYQYQRHPQSPPSPPVEEQKPSLPSISSLLSVADGEKAASEKAHQSPQLQHQQRNSSSPQLRQDPQQRPVAGAVQPVSTIVSNPRITLPPTPPMHPDPMVDGNQSPSTASTHSNTPYFLGQSLNNLEPHQQRQSGPPAPPIKRDSLPSQPSMSPYSTSAYAPSPYTSSPGAASSGSFYSPEPHYNSSMYGQRPLPSSFPPPGISLPVPANAANGSSVWQHHHYISASAQSSFPQSQDRYICSTCNKAFSRPSSLRIHSHSHTGEKPYKCPQPGCGKAFSVRSNMKRHERGCHASTSTTITTT